MKTVKPQKVGILTRPFSSGGRSYLGVGAMLYVPMSPATGVLLESSMWKMAAAEIADSNLDAGMPKSRGEWWVAGKAFAPGGNAVPSVRVRAKVGEHPEKVLRVVGDRYWDPVTGATSNIRPFAEMPLDWQHAYGGPLYKQNPHGKGHRPVQVNGAELQWFPNVEDPAHPVKSPKEATAPAGFLPYDLAWPQRSGRAGTYDDKWLKTLFPGPPADFDWTVHNGAPRDQWIEGFFGGDERYTLEGMHPSRAVIEGQLPGLRARAFVTQRTADGESFAEVPLRLETLLFVPHRERVVMIFRGTVEVAEDDASDVLNLVLAAERADAPRDAAHYEAVLAKRLDPDRGAIESLRESDLMPADSALQPAEAAVEDRDETTELLKTEGLLQKNMRRRHIREVERVRQELRASGIDPDATFEPELFVTPELEAPDLDNLPETIERQLEDLQQKEEEVMRRRTEIEAEARLMCENAGMDFYAMNEKARQQSAGPPRRTTRMMVEGLREAATEANGGEPVDHVEAMFANPRFFEGIDEADRQKLEMYRASAHLGEPAERLRGDEAVALRDAVANAEMRDFRGRDLTGADLSGLDLRGADFTEALLESATFEGADLAGARFDAAVLARADLRGAKAVGATFVKANLGASHLEGADLSGADLTEAVLQRANLTGAALVGAKLADGNVHEAVFDRADLRGAVAASLMLMDVDLTGCRFEDADLRGATFYKARGAGVSFARAQMARASFVECELQSPDFTSAKLENLRVVLNCAMPGARFVEAELEGASMRETKFPDADFSKAKGKSVDLSGCDLSRAKFYRASVREGRFVRADLTDAVMISVDAMDAIFQSADLTRTDLSGANLHGVDLARIKPGVKSLVDALTTRARTLPVRRA